MIRVTNGFAGMNLPRFNQFLTVVVSSMTGNEYFPTLQAAAAALSVEADKYLALAVKAEKRDRDMIIARDANRQVVITMLHDLGMEVTAIAKNDAAILSSSGFNYTKPRQSTAPLIKPFPPRVSQGQNNGQIECKTTTQRGMKTVNYYITSDTGALTTESSNGWDLISYNKIKYTFSDLTPGQRYYIKVGLVGVKGQEVISDPVSYIPQ